jgi:hypothetical protein
MPVCNARLYYLYNMGRYVFLSVVLIFASNVCFAQTENNNSALPRFDYQIYLQKPAKEIKELLFYKECTPIKGKISDSKKNIIMKDYEPGNKVYVRVLYEDGTEEEFVRSPCFIDPVIL